MAACIEDTYHAEHGRAGTVGFGHRPAALCTSCAGREKHIAVEAAVRAEQARLAVPGADRLTPEEIEKVKDLDEVMAGLVHGGRPPEPGHACVWWREQPKDFQRPPFDKNLVLLRTLLERIRHT